MQQTTSRKEMLRFCPSDDAGRATLRVHAGVRSPHRVSRFLTGKFCEHLGSNIYQGMDAQVLRNPTFEAYPVGSRTTPPDGGMLFECDNDKIAAYIRSRAQRFGWPAEAAGSTVESYSDGLAAWWTREGARNKVRVSPDVGPHGGRAQRVEVDDAGLGIAQWTHLPLHRVRSYRFELVVRSPDVSSLRLLLYGVDQQSPVAETRIRRLSGAWGTFRGAFEIADAFPADAICRLALVAEQPGQFVIDRVLVWPEDHVDGADPDVVAFLKEARLPVLRWPGGNFVSGYHWEDGVGDPDNRSARPNYAWGTTDPNLFGTDEFMSFCQAVGCEPMICVNAGNGTPEEAARWVAYCNGPPDSPEGSKRAANGHPEPYEVRYWEIGNELYGRWQVHWTTAAGNADRYRRFAEAMLTADPNIDLYACGAPVFVSEEWNQTLFSEAVPLLKRTTDHVLMGSALSPATDPLDVYRDFMSYPAAFERKYAEIRQSMVGAGIEDPKLAITELQLFARIARDEGRGGAVRLDRSTLVSPSTLAEALYDTLHYHVAVRLAPFIELITHSATVNHGGGLRKERERVYANPCYYAQRMFANLAGALPVGIELTAPVAAPPLVLADLKATGFDEEISVIDALAAIDTGGALLLSIVHRGTGTIEAEIAIDGFGAGSFAEVQVLTGEFPWSANTLDAPELISPVEQTVPVQAGRLLLTVPPFSLIQVSIVPEL